MINFTEFYLLREVGAGITAFLLFVICYALGRFIYDHRVSLTVEDREARSAAIGLVIVFAGLMLRSFDLWLVVLSGRQGWFEINFWASSPWIYLATLVTVMVGMALTVRAFHPWPIWLFWLGAATVIPIVAALL